MALQKIDELVIDIADHMGEPVDAGPHQRLDVG